MESIDNLPPDEQQHFVRCRCGAFVDLRNLEEVFAHEHANLPKPQWSYVVQIGKPIAYGKNNGAVNLN